MNKAFLVSSKGGHYSELKKLKIDNYESIYIVEGVKDDLVNHTLISGTRSQKLRYLFTSIINTFYALFLFIRYRPKLLVSTGAHSCVVFFYIAKIFRCKTVYIESFAKVNSSSMTYRIIKNICTEVVVQHEEMLNVYEGSKYFGGVY